jgi:hypothetical protein
MNLSMRRNPGLRDLLRHVIGLAFILIAAIGAVLESAELVLAHRNAGLGTGTEPSWGLDRAPSRQKAEMAAVARRFGISKIDTRDRVELIDDLTKRGRDAVPAVMLGGLTEAKQAPEPLRTAGLIPLGGISNALTVLCNEAGQYVTYVSDEHGFRNPPGVWDAAHVDVAVVGESFAQGYCVGDGAGFADRLRSNHSTILNLGISGSAAILQLAAIKEFLPPRSPRIVLWVYCEGIDLGDTAAEAAQPLLSRYLDDDFLQGLLSRQPEVDALLRRHESSLMAHERAVQGVRQVDSLVTWMPRLKLWALREQLNVAYGFATGGLESREPPSAGLVAFREALAHARAATNEWGGQVYLVYLPSWSRYRNGPRFPERERLKVLEIANELMIPVIDVRSAFDAQTDPLGLFPYRRFGHYNEAGNEVVAETIRASLPKADRQFVAVQPRGATDSK